MSARPSRPRHAPPPAPPPEVASPLSEYLVAREPGRRERAENWRVGSRKTGRWEFPPHPTT